MTMGCVTDDGGVRFTEQHVTANISGVIYQQW